MDKDLTGLMRFIGIRAIHVSEHFTMRLEHCLSIRRLDIFKKDIFVFFFKENRVPKIKSKITHQTQTINQWNGHVDDRAASCADRSHKWV
jgi:hypothetical protein